MVENLSAKEQLGYGAGKELTSWLDETWGPAEVAKPVATPDLGTIPNAPIMATTPGKFDAIPTTPGKGLDIRTTKMYNHYTKKRGAKATRNNNPGNITGMGGKLLYGAKGFARSNTGDKGDQNQLVYESAESGFKAMHALAMKNYSGGPIKQQFNKWQTDKKSFNKKLRD